MVRHYTLTPEDLTLINRRRGDPNRLWFRRNTLLFALSRTDTPTRRATTSGALCLTWAEQLGIDV